MNGDSFGGIWIEEGRRRTICEVSLLNSVVFLRPLVWRQEGLLQLLS
jgi:hypothetical protein